jgi:TolB-like protein/Tfp pilus assembly protein PilF
MSDVFISYKAEDRSRVRPLVEALEADGLSVWWDAHIGGGDEWRDTIARHLDDAKCVIVVWSKRSVAPEGRFVRDEATRALRRHAYLPVRIDKVEPPLGFGETQALPLNGWKGDRADPRYLAVRNAARSMIGLEARADAPAHATAIGRRPLLVGGAAAAVAAGIGGWLLLKPGSARANSIAVLPFANLSGDPAQAYFSDGMAEELRSALSRIAGLKVVARTSSEMLRESDAKAAASKLGVEHIVSGSVRRSPSMIRVNAQLIDGDDGLERWSQTFDKPAGDLLEIQTSIAQNVAQALRIQIVGGERETLTLGGTRNPAAQDLYLRSNPGEQGDTKEALSDSIAMVNAAIALDPDFAQAHARKAFLLVLYAGVYALSSAEASRGYREALASANRAIAIAPRLAAGYATRGAVLRDRLDIGGALADLQRAVALPNNDSNTYRIHAMMLGQARHFAEAQRNIEQAKALDPLNPVSFEIEALLHVYQRDFPGAMRTAHRSLELAPERVQVRRILGNTLVLTGKYDEAASEYARLETSDYRRLLGEAYVAIRTGKRDVALAKLNAMQQRYGDAAMFQYAQIHAQLGMVDEAITALQKSYALRDPGLSGIRVDPFLDPVRGDPRFAAVEAKLNFPRT